MTNSEWTNRFLSTAEFFSLAKARLSLNTPEALTDPNVIPRDNDEDADPAVLAAIASMRPVRAAAVLVPIIARAEPMVLFTERTAPLADHAGEITFPGGKIDAVDASPAAAALREAEEEVSLDRRFVEPIGYLDVHVTPSGYRILPVLARVREGFSVQFGRDEGAPRNHRHEKAGRCLRGAVLHFIQFAIAYSQLDSSHDRARLLQFELPRQF